MGGRGHEEIRGPGLLRGGYDLAEAAEVASLLRAGNLPLGLDVEGLRGVGPTLGQELLERGRLALGWSVAALLALLAVAYGRRPALLLTGVASLALLLFFTVGLISALGLTVDLAAIAGLVLSIGMGMDAFILVFEALEGRFAADGRSPLGRLRRIYAFRGEGRTLVHANATTLLVVLLLFASDRLGSFARFLVVGLAASLLTLVATKWLLEILARKGWLEDIGSPGGRRWSPVDWIRRARPRLFAWRRAYFAAVALILLGTGGFLAFGPAQTGLELGADFQPGVQMQVTVAPQRIEALVDDLRTAHPETQVRHQLLLDSTAARGDERAEYLVTLEGREWQVDAVSRLVPWLDRHGAFLEGTQSIDARLSARRTLSSLSVFVLSFAFLGLYLGSVQPRLDRWWARGSALQAGRPIFFATVAAVVLDVALVLAALALLDIPLDLPVLAALLTIVGYSVNDSMVLWSHLSNPDEVRVDEAAGDRVVRVVDQILGRTVLTSLSTMIPALAILTVGLAPLAGFAWAVVVGTVAGTLSSLFVVASAASVAAPDCPVSGQRVQTELP